VEGEEKNACASEGEGRVGREEEDGEARSTPEERSAAKRHSRTDTGSFCMLKPLFNWSKSRMSETTFLR
jgi:hypothetical protein